jgi:hypothetical protein
MPGDPEVLTVTIPEAGKMLGLSRGLAYDAARAGLIPTLRFGQRLVVPKAALLKMLEDAGQKPNGTSGR